MQPTPALPLVPTLYKTKIPHTHSWPIGAEAISKALAGVPQFERLELTFWDYRFLPQAASYQVLEVTYRKLGKLFSASKDMIERGDLEAKWTITIKPVPRSQRHAVRSDLLERGLPFVKKWLMENASDGHQGRAKMTCFWYEDEQRLGMKPSRRASQRGSKSCASRS